MCSILGSAECAREDGQKVTCIGAFSATIVLTPYSYLYIYTFARSAHFCSSLRSRSLPAAAAVSSSSESRSSLRTFFPRIFASAVDRLSVRLAERRSFHSDEARVRARTETSGEIKKRPFEILAPLSVDSLIGGGKLKIPRDERCTTLIKAAFQIGGDEHERIARLIGALRARGAPKAVERVACLQSAHCSAPRAPRSARLARVWLCECGYIE